jgi:POT family proton-dependent oligopeptide transporter
MSTRRLLLFFALPLVLLLERFAYFGARSMLGLYMRDLPPEGLGLQTTDMGSAFATLSLMLIAAPLLGGAIAIALGPGITLGVGAFLASSGYALLGAGGAGDLDVALGLIALGVGLFRPSALALAASELGEGRENVRNALFLLIYVAINVGAFLAPMSLGFLRTRAGFSVIFGGAAGAALLASILGGGLLLALRFLGPAPKDRPATDNRAVIGVLLLFVAVVPSIIAQAAESETLYSVAGGAKSAMTMTAIFGVNPIITIGASLAGCVTMLILSVTTRFTVPTLLVIGAGLVACAIGAGGLALLAAASAPLPLLMLVTAITAVGEAVTGPLALSRASVAAPPRFSALMIGGWMAATSGVGMVAHALSGLGVSGITLVGAALASAAAGASLILFSRPMAVSFFREPPPNA